MAKRDLPIKDFQDMLNVYVANGWFPWKHKIVKNKKQDRLLAVQPDGKILLVAHDVDNDSEISHLYSVAELFSVESCLHDFVSWKTRGHARQKNDQPSDHDVWYSYHYINMATMSIWQKMEYFLKATDMS